MSTHSDAYLGYFPEAEIVLGICCPLGTDYRPTLDTLRNYLSQFGYRTNEIKLSDKFNDLLERLGEAPLVSTSNRAAESSSKIEAGNEIRRRTQKPDILALVAAGAIAAERPEENETKGKTQGDETTGFLKSLPVPRMVHVIVSLKRPEEVETLRRIYGAGFFLIGIASTEAERLRYLLEERGVEETEISQLIDKDEKEADDFGQRTRDTFFLSDVFLRADEHKTGLRCFLDLVFGCPYETPTIAERSMYAAYAASFSSGDLSRQVGAAVVNEHGDLLSVGWNDVPKFGGGLYGAEDGPARDMDLGEDSNDGAKSSMADAIGAALGPEWATDERMHKLRDALKQGGLFDITEYQRAVHAEMEAILACGRNGRTTRNAFLYVTTFPCHNCTKHIIAAGFQGVFYIEPYAKSKALQLHKDAISVSTGEKTDPSHREQIRIPFLSFIGVGPRRYLDLFSLTLGTGNAVERKKDGKKIQWRRATAVPRLQMQPISYLDREELALNRLNELLPPRRI
jgi:deoxycytidylate deaminase